MKSNRSRCLGALALAFAATAVAAQTSDVEDLSFIAGCWGADNREAGSGEYWVLTDAGELLGIGRTVENGVTVSYDFKSIRRQGDVISLSTRPACPLEETLHMVNREEKAVTFQAQDATAVPERITYRRVSADRLVMTLEGRYDGLLRSVDVPMTRQDCQSLARRPAGAAP
jgi:hypothetical protein